MTRYRRVEFAVPLRLSSGSISWLTEAQVVVDVETRVGRRGVGLGSVLLSYPWTHGSDAGMRASVEHFAALLPSFGYGDPIQHGVRLLDIVDQRPGPRLAADVALGPVDQAVHDAWARASGLSAYAMYGAAHLNHDLGTYLGPDFAGRWPADWLAADPASCLAVQYVLGVDEPLEAGHGRRWLKIKLSGRLGDDISRVRLLVEDGVHVSLDANEAYTDEADLLALVRSVRASYIEQPVPRGREVPAGSPVPLLVDEGLPDPRELDAIAGWDGIVVKTARGQTAALLAYGWAKCRDRFVVQQDLTHVGPALAHAAAFAAHCHYSIPAFECNSLHYAPDGNRELALERPGLVDDRDGTIQVSASGVGIR